MNNKVIKIFIFTILSCVFWITRVFSFDASLEVNSQEIDINNSFNIIVNIKWDNIENIQITNISWLEDFNILRQSESQNSVSQTLIHDWQEVSKNIHSRVLSLLLQAKQKWNYIIWPVELTNWEETFTTNSLDLKILGEKKFLNNSFNSNILTQTNQDNTNKKLLENIQGDSVETIEGEKIKFFNYNFYTFIIICCVLLFTFLYWLYFGIKKYKQNMTHPVISDNINSENESSIISEQKWEYPWLDDNDFMEKITIICKEKIATQYHINNISYKTFDEIIQELKNMENINQDIVDILSLLKAATYANIEYDKNNILHRVKEL